jgi:hypothetical protein
MESVKFIVSQGVLPITVGLNGNGLFFGMTINAYGTYSFNNVPCGVYTLILTDSAGHIKVEEVTLPTIITTTTTTV